MHESKYYKVKVTVKTETARGRIKKMSEEFLVNGVNMTDVEKKIYVDYEGDIRDWEIHSITETKVIKVID